MGQTNAVSATSIERSFFLVTFCIRRSQAPAADETIGLREGRQDVNFGNAAFCQITFATCLKLYDNENCTLIVV